MIAILSLAVTQGMKLRHTQKSIDAYPTRTEIMRITAIEWEFTTLTPMMKKAFGVWLKVSRMFG